MRIKYVGPKKFKKIVGEEFNHDVLNSMRHVFTNFWTLYSAVRLKYIKKECKLLCEQDYYSNFTDTNECLVLFGMQKTYNKDGLTSAILINSFDFLDQYKRYAQIMVFT